jgi:hypothetical protein
MQLDSVINLQAEVFQDVFGFVEAPGAMASAAAVDEVASFVHPRALDDGIAQVQRAAVSLEAADFAGYSDPSRAVAPVTRRARGRVHRNETDRMALGVGHKAGGLEDEFELAVVYQDRKPDYGNLLRQIAEKGRGEVRLIYGGIVRAAAPWHRERNSTLRMGSSIAHRRVGAGTLACFVKDRGTGRVGVLSNNHVLANTNNAGLGDEIRQPGSVDGGGSQDRMASLAGFVPLLFGGATNHVDCAWATHDDPPRGEDRTGRYDSAGNRVGQLSGVLQGNVLPGDFVTKIGRTTGYTQGEIDLINVNNLTVDMGGGAIARFDGQLQIKGLSAVPFSRRGDSGSLIVDQNSEPVGLLFGSSSTGGFDNTGLTWANSIGIVLNLLNLEVLK